MIAAGRRSKCSRTRSSIRVTGTCSVLKHSTRIENGRATPIAYATWIWQRSASPAATTFFATYRAAYAARYVAKNIVAAGLADRAQIQVAYAIGVARPFSILVECFGTAHVEETLIEDLVREHFDLRPAAIIRDLDLRRPIYAKTAAYGHFGRDDPDFTWERTQLASQLREAAGLGAVEVVA